MTENKPNSPGNQQLNQRRTLRAPLIVERIPCEDAQKSFFGYAKNLSRGGLFVATLKPRQPGEEFILEMTLPTLQPLAVRCRCQVIWTRGFQRKSPYEPGMGLRFVDLSEDIAAQIDVWVQARAATD